MTDENYVQTIEMTENASGRIVFAPKTAYGKAAHWTEAEGDEVAGDAAATGTTIVSVSVPATSRFICMSLMASTDVPAILNIAYGTLAAHTDIYHIDIYSAQAQVVITEDTPIFVYHNSTAAAVTLLMLAPQTAKGAATNNDANHHFHGYIGGVLLKD